MCALIKTPNADTILVFIRGLTVTSGEHLDQLVTVLPWQERFIRGCFQPKKQVQTAALSIGRGNGKTTLVSWLASAVLFGPLNRKNAKVIVAASSFEQGGTIYKAVMDLLPDRFDKKSGAFGILTACGSVAWIRVRNCRCFPFRPKPAMALWVQPLSFVMRLRSGHPRSAIRFLTPCWALWARKPRADCDLILKRPIDGVFGR